jgi:hypothetical protein
VAERVLGGENNGLQHKKTRESKGSMNREKKLIMEKLILQEKYRYNNNKMYRWLGKISGLIALASSPDIGSWYSGLCGEQCCPSGQTAWEEMAFFQHSLVL